jgi:hypothetical protein
MGEFSRDLDFADVSFLLRELRTPELLVEPARHLPALASEVAYQRPAVRAALDGGSSVLSASEMGTGGTTKIQVMERQ